MSLRVTIDCPSCKGHHTLRGVMSEQEMKRAGMIARCCYSCGYTNQNRLPKGTKSQNDRLAGKLVARAKQYGQQVRDCTIGFRNGMWYPLSKAQSDARREEQALVAATSGRLRDSVPDAVPGGMDEAVEPDPEQAVGGMDETHDGKPLKPTFSFDD